MLSLSIDLFCLVSVVSMTSGAHLPKYIKACAVRSPTFKQCAVKNGNEAIPFIIAGDKIFGIPNFNPLKLPLIEFSSGELKLNGTDVIVTGLRNIAVTDIGIDLDKKHVFMNLTCTKSELNFDYSIGGKLASLPIEGRGRGTIILYNTTYNYEYDFNKYQKNGKEYMEIAKDDFALQPKKVFLHLDNLFNGNKLLGDNMNKFLNENWPEILIEFRPAITQLVGSIVKRILYSLLKKVPLEEMFTDY